MSRRWNRVLVGLILLAALATAPAAAWTWNFEREEARRERPVYTRFVEALEKLLTGLTGIWEQEGLAGDPNGTPPPPSGGPTTQGDEGLAGDPNG